MENCVWVEVDECRTHQPCRHTCSGDACVHDKNAEPTLGYAVVKQRGHFIVTAIINYCGAVMKYHTIGGKWRTFPHWWRTQMNTVWEKQREHWTNQRVCVCLCGVSRRQSTILQNGSWPQYPIRLIIFLLLNALTFSAEHTYQCVCVCRVRDKENNKVILYNGVFKKFYSFYLQTSRGRAQDKKKGFLIVASLVNCAFIFISNCCEPPPAPWLIVLHLYLPYFFLLSVS